MDSRARSGWKVTLSGTGINLALGAIYAWSVISAAMPESWGWSNANKALPYSIALICFALAMIPAGKLQDMIGPRWVATMGGIFFGAGCIVAGLSGSSLAGFVVGFGILGGFGIGFGYASATPPALKWFPPEKTGMIAGIVVAGFGLASVYIAPLANFLLDVFSTTTSAGVAEKGISTTMIVLGIGFFVIVTILSQFLKNPPPAPAAAGAAAAASANDKTVKDMLRDAQFYVTWFMFFAGAGAGLTFISVAAGLGKKSLGELAFLGVVILAIGNAGGRILAGFASDIIGRSATLFICFILQAITICALFFLQGSTSWLIILIVLLSIGANYGANLAIFPAIVKDCYGLKNYGINYGVLFTSWGVAGFFLPWLNGFIKDRTGSSDLSYMIIVGLLVAAAVMSLVNRSLSAKKK